MQIVLLEVSTASLLYYVYLLFCIRPCPKQSDQILQIS